MLSLALKILRGDRVKYGALILGVAFTAFLVTFAACYFCGFMTRGFALIAENTATEVWVMDPTVDSDEQTTNLPDDALARVRSVPGVAAASPLLLGTAEARFPNGRFMPFQVIGVDSVTLAGLPALPQQPSPTLLRLPGAAIADEGGSVDKLLMPARRIDTWPHDQARHLQVPLRQMQAGDLLEVHGHRVEIIGVSDRHPRFPARPLLYLSIDNARRILPPERRQLTFILVQAAQGISARRLAQRIQRQTGLKARSSDDFERDTVIWYLLNSEDVGDVSSMLTLACTVGFGVIGVMLYMFTHENLRQYAILSALGCTPRRLLMMVFVQAGACAILGTGLGVGLCAALDSLLVHSSSYPFRLMWFTPLAGGLMVLIISLVAAALSARPVLKLEPARIFAGR